METPLSSSASFTVNGYAVPVVQELSLKGDQQPLPSRYVRPEHERPASCVTDDVHIPVIDLSLLLHPSQDHTHRPEQLQKLAEACENWGFLQVINHGVPLWLLERMMKASKEFFELPLQEKLKYSDPNEKISTQGYGQRLVVSNDQPLDWADMFSLVVSPQHLRKPNLWPKCPSHLSETLELYAREVENLAVTLVKLFALNLGLKEDRNFVESIKTSVCSVRVNYYPPCPQPDLALGISPHSDSTLVTILLQDDETEGLQIRHGDTDDDNGCWVSVKPIPGAFVVNIGDMIEVNSNGKYKSVEHRAVTNTKLPRMSIATNYTPGPEEIIGPFPELVDEEHPPLCKTFKRSEYNDRYFSHRLQGKQWASQFYRIDK